MSRFLFATLLSLVLSLVSLTGDAHAQFAQFYAPEAIAPSPSSLSLAHPTLAHPNVSTPIGQFALGDSMFSFSGTRPNNLGVTDGKLAACPSTPNCVSSQAPKGDTEHYIMPLTYSKSPSETMAALKSVITDMERTDIITESENYLYAEFTSALMGFVDDVEFYLDDKAGVIHVRSASRLGQSDLGVNRKRVEEIRDALDSVA
ncbi:MAG: DUF1499 domain-containing protein [Leptolyngbyaceae bacterium]|nr:DUF1499 domain-containing protein [Leptolyngbyaceae bacterium]